MPDAPQASGRGMVRANSWGISYCLTALSPHPGGGGVRVRGSTSITPSDPHPLPGGCLFCLPGPHLVWDGPLWAQRNLCPEDSWQKTLGRFGPACSSLPPPCPSLSETQHLSYRCWGRGLGGALFLHQPLHRQVWVAGMLWGWVPSWMPCMTLTNFLWLLRQNVQICLG